jgi:hypothetical protein
VKEYDDERNVPQLERLDDFTEVIGPGVIVVAVERLVGLSETPQVDRHRPKNSARQRQGGSIYITIKP